MSKRMVYKNTVFTKILFSDSLNSFAFQFYAFTIPLIIYEFSKSALAISSMRAVEFLPNLLLALFIGVFIDRVNRKKLLVSVSIIQIVMISILLLILISGQLINLFPLYIIGFVISLTSYTRANIIHSILPNIVDEDLLSESNSQFSIFQTLSSMIAPPLAGLVYGIGMGTFSIAIYMVGTLIFVFIILSIKDNNFGEIIPSDNNFKEDLYEGWKELRSNNYLWKLTIIILFINLAVSLSFAILVFYALDEINVDEKILGLVLVGALAGSLFGGFANTYLIKAFSAGNIIKLSFYIMLLGFLALYISSNWTYMALSLFCINFSSTQVNIQLLSIRQSTTPNNLLGRVSGTSSTIMKLAIPLSYIFAGLLTEIINVKYLFLISAMILIIIISYTKSLNETIN